jgi:beta-phosphoglucomutase-like phosphatase (HAD superfamily)
MQYDIQPGVKGLIFDLDGTLVDSMPHHFEGWKKAIAKYGGHIDTAFLLAITGSPGIQIAAALIEKNGLKGKVAPEQILKIKIEEFNNAQYLIRKIEPVVAIVRKYYGILPMAVGTGGPRDAVDKTLEVTDLKKYFEIIVTADDVEKHKPDPETFLKCAELMELEPHHIEVFEDGDLGIKASYLAGMITTDVRSWYKSDW